jgi:hypothetical protein
MKIAIVLAKGTDAAAVIVARANRHLADLAARGKKTIEPTRVGRQEDWLLAKADNC